MCGCVQIIINPVISKWLILVNTKMVAEFTIFPRNPCTNTSLNVKEPAQTFGKAFRCIPADPSGPVVKHKILLQPIQDFHHLPYASTNKSVFFTNHLGTQRICRKSIDKMHFYIGKSWQVFSGHHVHKDKKHQFQLLKSGYMPVAST